MVFQGPLAEIVRHAPVTMLGPRLVQFPTTAEGLKELMERFEGKFGFPMVVGFADGTHIPIKQPNENAHDYFCYKMKCTLSVQAVCDENCCFLDVDCSHGLEASMMQKHLQIAL